MELELQGNGGAVMGITAGGEFGWKVKSEITGKSKAKAQSKAPPKQKET
jgi:hypothetical protein